MVWVKLKKFTFYEEGKEKEISVKQVSQFSTGLMFRRKSPPLLFDFGRFRNNLSIFSLFCKPFEALWLDEEKRVIKRLKITKWKWWIPGEGRYLLEIPLNNRR